MNPGHVPPEGASGVESRIIKAIHGAHECLCSQKMVTLEESCLGSTETVPREPLKLGFDRAMPSFAIALRRGCHTVLLVSVGGLISLLQLTESMNNGTLSVIADLKNSSLAGRLWLCC
jgi:hypothetical protein